MSEFVLQAVALLVAGSAGWMGCRAKFYIEENGWPYWVYRLKRKLSRTPPQKASILSADIAKEMQEILKTSLTFTQQVNREYDQMFKNPQVGQTITIRKPQAYVRKEEQ